MKTLSTPLAGLMLLMAHSAWAIDEVCVSSTNDLAAALLEVQSVPLTIKVTQGNYRLDSTSWLYPGSLVRAGSSLLGGYTPACASRQVDPGNTTFVDANGADNDFVATLRGDFTLEGIGFNFPGLLFIQTDPDHPNDAAISIRRTIFNSAGMDFYVNGDDDTHSVVRISDTLIFSAQNCAVTVNLLGGHDAVYFVNDTILNNFGGLCLGDDTAADAPFKIYNSIIWNNGEDLSGAGEATVVDADIGTIFTVQLVPAPIGLLHSNPQLNGNFRPIVPGSPVIDAGTDAVPGGLPATDIVGTSRVIGAATDLGAYESLFDGSTTQTVTNAGDSGLGSLRQAIINANGSSGINSIQFAIGTGCGPHVITLASNLPAITGSTVIDGYTQTGASRNDMDTGDDSSICIIIESGNSAATDGLRVLSGAADGVKLTVDGIAFGGFTGNAIGLSGGSAHRVNGNHFGGSVNGHTLAANGTNIRLGAGVHDAIIGGDGAGQRNLIGGASNVGVFIAGAGTAAHDNQIVNNYIGVGWGTTFTNRGNGGSGIYVAGSNTTISDNLVGNNGDGIEIDGSLAFGTAINGNSIGGATGIATAFGNAGSGVRTENIASDNAITDNTIANNGQRGVDIVTGVHNRIRRNAIYANGAIGIDLVNDGVTANDADGGIVTLGYANRGQNFPVLSSAAGGHQFGTISGTLSTTPGDYNLDFFFQSACDASGNGEGRELLRTATVTVPTITTGTQGVASFTLAINLDFPEALTGGAITATATDPLGNTSEFSACRAYVDDTIFSNGFDHGLF